MNIETTVPPGSIVPPELDVEPGETVTSGGLYQRIVETGYVHVRTPLSKEQFEELASGIGSIELKTDIKINLAQDKAQRDARKVKGRPSAFQAKGFDFHMDCPAMRVLCWLCIEQDAVDGTMQFLDTQSILKHFTHEEIETMSRIKIRYSDMTTHSSNEEFLLEPLVQQSSGGHLVYYQPWLLLDSYDEEQSRILGRFQTYLKTIGSDHAIGVRPMPGESVFIDNRRLLHGRAAVSDQSRRHLLRLFVRVPGTEAPMV